MLENLKENVGITGQDTGADKETESSIVERAVSGERPAFEVLYQKYYRRIYGLVFRMTGTAQEAEEVTQEVFYQAYKNLPGFQGRSRFYTWIFRIATNVSLQYLKRRSRRSHDVSYEDTEESRLSVPGPVSLNPEHEVESRDFLRALEVALNRLSPNQRAVMILGPIQGHNYAEMAEILGTTEDVIKGRIHRARENIRELLKDFRNVPATESIRKVVPITPPKAAATEGAAAQILPLSRSK